MGKHRNHHQDDPEVLQELKDRELGLENLINKYRFFLITFLIIGDYITAHFLGILYKEYIFYGVPAIALLYFAIYKLHKITKKKSNLPLLKYFTVVIDYMLVFGGFFEAKDLIMTTLHISIEQLLLLITLFYLIVNTLSALRIQKQVIIFSTILGVVLNSVLHFHFGSLPVIIIYSGTFILVSGFFNIYVSRFIFKFYVVNNKLGKTLENLEQANEEILTKNEEINMKNDELVTQNEYLAAQRDKISYQKNQITSSIEYAKRIQDAVLDTQDEINHVVPDSFVLLKPKDIVSGDFYWFKNLQLDSKNYRVFAAVDCTGHGVPGGFMSMLGTSFLNELIAEFKSELNLATLLNRLRQEIKKQLHQTSNSTQVKDGMDMAICAIDYEHMQVQFAGANNPLYLIRNINEKPAIEIQEIKPDKMPIGVYLKENESFTNHIIDLNKGDLLYIFSDGFCDQFGGENGEKFKKRRFKELLLSVAHLPMSEQKNKLEENLLEWMGTDYEQIDDITVIGVRI